jgi:hypothetical protein
MAGRSFASREEDMPTDSGLAWGKGNFVSILRLTPFLYGSFLTYSSTLMINNQGSIINKQENIEYLSISAAGHYQESRERNEPPRPEIAALTLAMTVRTGFARYTQARRPVPPEY